MAGAAAGRKQPTGRLGIGQEILAALEVFAQGNPPRLAQRHDPLLAALARDHEKTRIATYCGERQGYQLRYPETGRIEQLEDATEAWSFLSGPALCSVDQRLDFRFP